MDAPATASPLFVADRVRCVELTSGQAPRLQRFFRAIDPGRRNGMGGGQIVGAALGMTRTVTAILGAVALGCSSGGVWAVDSVKARFTSGYPPPSVSSESITLEVMRIPAALRGDHREIDKFFESVRAVLKSCGVTKSWQYLPPDSPFVRLEIALDGNSLELITDRFGLRPEAQRDLTAPLCDLPRQSENDRNRAALARILEMMVERLRAKAGK
jgi:hypothetical protein